MQYYHQLRASVLSIERDVTKFYEKGNKSAAIRARNALKDIKEIVRAARRDIQDTKHTKGLLSLLGFFALSYVNT
ncbi:MAG: histone H1 [Bacteroidota bacterium]